MDAELWQPVFTVLGLGSSRYPSRLAGGILEKKTIEWLWSAPVIPRCAGTKRGANKQFLKKGMEWSGERWASRWSGGEAVVGGRETHRPRRRTHGEGRSGGIGQSGCSVHNQTWGTRLMHERIQVLCGQQLTLFARRVPRVSNPWLLAPLNKPAGLSFYHWRRQRKRVLCFKFQQNHHKFI